MVKAKVKNEPLVFRPIERGWAVIVLLLMTLAYLVWLLRSDMSNTPEIDAMIVFFLFFLGFYIWVMVIENFQTALTFYADVLELAKGGSRLRIPYDEIKSIEVETPSTRNRQYKNLKQLKIVFNKKIQPEVNGIAERLIYGRATHSISLDAFDAMPLAYFWEYDDYDTKRQMFESSQLVRALYKHLPHLFDDWEIADEQNES